MKKLTAIVVLSLAVAATLVWQFGTLGSEKGDHVVGGDPLVNKIRIDMYGGGGLAPDEQPSGYVKNVDVVALVTVEQVEEASWNNQAGTMPSDFLLPVGTRTGEFTFVYTPVVVRIDSYIKGVGPDKLVVSQLGGTRDGITTEVNDWYTFSPGMKAVVFLNAPGTNINGWTLVNAYIITSSKAYSNWDKRELPAEALLAQLRQAAAENTQ